MPDSFFIIADLSATELPIKLISSNPFRLLRNFICRPAFEKAWFLPVWFMLGASRFAILFIPFRRLAPWLGIQQGIAPWVPLVGAQDEARALSIARVVQMAARYTPWESNCFPQAVTARMLLGIYDVPYCLFFGLDRVETSMNAHAWIASGKVSVTGGRSFDRYTVVGCFIAPVLATYQERTTNG